MHPPPLPSATHELETASLQLRDWLAPLRRVFVLTGAGCSTGSGIPDYRGPDGQWKRSSRPVTLQAFLGDDAIRARYWARSFVGWPIIGSARPNAAHRALGRWQESGRLAQLLTQNVDGLHQQAGSSGVIDLHGRLDQVICLQCGARESRAALQARLAKANPDWVALRALQAPDGDAELEGLDFTRFQVPACLACAGLLKPDVVFFGENVPRDRVEAARLALEAADAVLVVGSSLMVYSGYRFVVKADALGLPVAIVNRGHTRADALATLKLEVDCTGLLPLALHS